MSTESPPRRLCRSRDDRMLGGVAGGVAAYFDVDSALVRLAFVVLVLAAGSGLLLYLVAWIVIPEESAAQSRAAAPDPPGPPPAADADPGAAALAALPASTPRSRSASAAGRGARLVAGTVLVTVGALFLLDRALPNLHHFFWPAAIIVLGLGLVVHGARR